jgi:hypothetical protein
MKRTSLHDDSPDRTRYLFDFELRAPHKGWAQFDTTQDAFYYGNWVNPITLELVSYAEGDVVRTKCDDENEFKAELRRMVDWHKGHGFFKGIDGMCNPSIIAAFERLGFKESLH